MLAVCAALTLSSGILPSLPALAQSGVQRIYKSARPPLPAMGPSLRRTVGLVTEELPGTIIVRKDERALFLVTGKGEALRYQISVGREGFGWTGHVTVGLKKEWPDWRPPSDMRKRQPDLPEFVPPGPYNPLGARALYLHRQGRDTLYRIHGTNDPAGVGFDGTSGCFRLTNTDIIDLFNRVALGAKVIVQ
ncbi:L,D-transpeptidase [Pseudaminobacter arsenicus]|uniref:L,D-transpeptidase n=1 Tax=Borborobacter arsenicus TaxID=1851146 RepID=A0A432V2L6_9HYPH|nr:L,D-transpeptidase [Pseudaminobacter arsenicus]RUM96365.1 L,D-transpeptidase [Pseudaminobacter arsenicus]